MSSEAPKAADVPPPLKSVTPFINTATQFESRDPVIAYYCRMHALQTGIAVNDKSDPRSKALLLNLMTHLETFKKQHIANHEALKNEVLAESHIESQAIELFRKADHMDRSGVASNNLVKIFYTTTKLFEVLAIFREEPSEEVKVMYKYAAWKATYIASCIKSGTTPVPGPGPAAIKGSSEEEELSAILAQLEVPGQSPGAQSFNSQPAALQPSVPSNYVAPPMQPHPQPHITPMAQPHQPAAPPPSSAPAPSGFVDFEEASKCCKFAQSAITYEDVPTAIRYLETALAILKK